MKLIRYDYPTTSRVNALSQLFDQAFNDFSNWPNFEGFSRAHTPAVDLYEDTEAYYARFELPGVKREALHVELENAVLTVNSRSEQKDENKQDITAFSRSISVPEGTNSDKIHAKYEDGILTVTLPKSERRKPKAIEIK